jgi:hypothetical protein
MSEKGLAFLLLKKTIKEINRKATVTSINKSLISMCMNDPEAEIKSL